VRRRRLTKTGAERAGPNGREYLLGSTNITGGTLQLARPGASFGIHWNTNNAFSQVNNMAATAVAGVPGFAMGNWNNGNNLATNVSYSSATNVVSPVANAMVQQLRRRYSRTGGELEIERVAITKPTTSARPTIS